MKITLASPRSFCPGVERAVETVKLALTLRPNVFVLHEIVHNKNVVSFLKDKGAVFVDDIKDVPDGEILVISAHGASKAVLQEANERGMEIIDATCPMVHKIHLKGLQFAAQGRSVVLIGQKGHDEVEGTAGQIPNAYVVSSVQDLEDLPFDSAEKIGVISQTTFSPAKAKEIEKALAERFSDIIGSAKEDICAATRMRQLAVRDLAKQVDVFIVLGSRNSSNSRLLRDCAEKNGAKAYLIDSALEINPDWVVGKRIGVTAGASAPEQLVTDLLFRLQFLNLGKTTRPFSVSVAAISGEERKFVLPSKLKQLIATRNNGPTA